VKRYLQRVRHPERYHGGARKPPFFEGWYYKLVDARGGHRYAIIPGLFKSDDPEQDHAFVQVLDGITGRVVYHRYPSSAFVSGASPRAASQRGDSERDGGFVVTVGASRFTQHYLSLQLASPEQSLYGEVHFEGVRPWPVTWASPGVMGPFGYLVGNRVLALECNHGVLSLDHGLRGALVVDGPEIERAVIDWSGGRGYVEKDWGASFPSAWVWMQSNHFQAPNTCLTASIATIPTLGLWFRGMIVGLLHEERLYRFATYTGARLEHLHVDERAVTWVMRDRTHRLEIHATRAEGGLLRGPSTDAMGVRVPETLSALIEVRLSRLHRPQVILEDTGRFAGLEVVGDLHKLVTRDA
jgi:hypothetical protein